jgi:hypothetical protein
VPKAARLRRASRSPYAWGAAAYVLIRLTTAHWQPVAPCQDTGAYKALASLSLFDGDFYTGDKPFGTALLWKLLREDHVRVVGQLLLSIASWLVLAATFARVVHRPWLRLGAFGLVLAFSLTAQVTLWDSLLLSESLTLSLFALAVAAWLEVARAPTWRMLGLALALLLALAVTRDSNAFLVAMTVPFLVAWLVVSRRRVLPALAVVAAAGICAGGFAVASSAHRSELGLFHVIGVRLKNDSEAVRYFTERDTPGWPELVRARKLSDVDRLYTRTPCVGDCATFRRWLREDGTSTYVSYMLSHPRYTVFKPLKNVHSWLASDLRYGGYITYGRTALPDPLPAILWPAHATQLLFWLVLVGGAAILVAVRFGVRRAWAVPAVVTALALPHGMVVWLGEATPDIDRHGLLPSVQARLGLLLLGVLVADALLDRNRATQA